MVIVKRSAVSRVSQERPVAGVDGPVVTPYPQMSRPAPPSSGMQPGDL